MLQNLAGQNLAGWRIEVWYELRLPTGETGSKIDGYFTDEALAKAAGLGRAWYNGNGVVNQVFVLTHDSQTGYLLNAACVKMSNEPKIRAEVVAKAMEKLDPEVRELLKLK